MCIVIANVIEQQISILELFLKDHLKYIHIESNYFK